MISGYTWDHRNRLVGVSEYDASGAAVRHTQYVYDNDDLRVRRAVDTWTGSAWDEDAAEHHVWGPTDRVAVVEQDAASHGWLVCRAGRIG